MSFEDKCVHCDHYRENLPCCFCGGHKYDAKLQKTREEHLEELGEDEIEL